MAARSVEARLADMVEAIAVIRSEVADLTLDAFEADRNKRWLVERALEILSETSRHLPAETKGRHTGIRWQQIAGIGNVLRHDYERIAADVLWNLAHAHLPELELICRDELDRERARVGDSTSREPG